MKSSLEAVIRSLSIIDYSAGLNVFIMIPGAFFFWSNSEMYC